MRANLYGFMFTTLGGNLVEWYDFALYGYFATVIAQLFFPNLTPSTSLLMTFGVFAVGFLARPLGGIFFGYLGDKYGRKIALLISIFLIIFPTFLIGILPNYEHIGIIAPILLTILRILQGIAVSGELTSGAIFLLESVADHNKNRYASYIMCSTYVGLTLGALISMLVSWLFSPVQILAYAWRIPFLFSLFLGIAAAVMRFKCSESPVFQNLVAQNKISKAPLKELLRYHAYPLLLTLLLSSNLAVTIYLLIGYFPASLESHFHLSTNQSMLICCIGLLGLVYFVLLMGLLMNKYKPSFLFPIGSLLFILFGSTIFDFLLSGNLIFILLAVCMTSLFIAPIAATLMLLLMDLFPSHLRCLGISTGYNLSMTLFGGTTPFISLWLVNYYHTERAPLFCIYLCSFITLFAFFLLNIAKIPLIARFVKGSWLGISK